MKLIVPSPDRAYLNDMVWLPRNHIVEASLKQALQFWVTRGNDVVIEKLWYVSRDHLVIPRQYFPQEQLSNFPFPTVDLRPKQWPSTNVVFKGALDPERGQVAAYAALQQADGGVLNLAPGKGKTVLACKYAGDAGSPTLIVVHNSYLMQQWQERIEQFLELPPGRKLGIIQEKVFDWQQPVVLAMINTLALRAKEGNVPVGFSHHFGQVFFDEVHHLSAPLFIATAPLILGKRFGLTATDERNDGFDFVYKYHIGGVFYSDMSTKVGVDIYFQQTPNWVDLDDSSVRDRTGELHIGKLRSALADDKDSLDFREKCLREALAAGRKVLAIGHSKNMLLALADRFTDAGLIVAETPQEDRTKMVKKCRITFAIGQLGIEGLDDDHIDAAFFLTPIKDKVGIIQALGRLQRHHATKKTPILVVFDDVRIGPLHYHCEALRKLLLARGYTFRTLQVPP